MSSRKTRKLPSRSVASLGGTLCCRIANLIVSNMTRWQPRLAALRDAGSQSRLSCDSEVLRAGAYSSQGC